MPTYVITPAGAPRFDGDFQIASAGQTLTAVEQNYLEAVNAALGRLATDSAADVQAAYPQTFLVSRQNTRKNTALALATQARRCDSGNSACDPNRVAAILADYQQRIPKFGLADRHPPRFESDFEIVLADGFNPSVGEQELINQLLSVGDELAADKRNDAVGQFSPGVVLFRTNQRASTVAALRGIVDNLWAVSALAGDVVNDILMLRGQYQAKRDRLKRRLFNVKFEPSPNNPQDDNFDDTLEINLLGDLPPPEDWPSPEKQQLYVDLNKTNAIIQTVCTRLAERAGARWYRGVDRRALREAHLLQREFILKLADVARIGLELPYTQLARLALTEIRNEFFLLESGRIKNIYVHRLGFWAGITALALLSAYVWIVMNGQGWALTHKNFLLSACGAAIGTWTSFSIRQVQFSFEDLAMVEENALDPPVRIVFVIILTLAACLLFWNSAVNIEIGNLKTQPGAFKLVGSVALLVGLFAGLSERALATAISGRAAAFVKGIAGA